LQLLELIALGAGVEAEPSVRGKAPRSGTISVPTQREGRAIAASTEAGTGDVVSSTSLAQGAEKTRFAGRIWTAGHGGVKATRHRGYSSLAAPVKT
jgi:hypothetical protein